MNPNKPSISILLWTAAWCFCAAPAALCDDLNVQFTADEIHCNDAGSVAKGKATFNDGKVTIRGEHLDFSAALRQLRCIGVSQAEIGGVKVALNNATYDLKTKAITSKETPDVK